MGQGHEPRSLRPRLIDLPIWWNRAIAIVGDLDLTQAWLVIGYVLTLFIIGSAFVYHRPNDAKLKAIVDASPDDRPSERLRALVEAPLGRAINLIDGLVWLAIVFVMVTKPFS